MRYIIILCVCMMLQGCFSSYYANRMQEIEYAYQNGMISTAEYLSLKGQVDQAAETAYISRSIRCKRPITVFPQ